MEDKEELLKELKKIQDKFDKIIGKRRKKKIMKLIAKETNLAG